MPDLHQAPLYEPMRNAYLYCFHREYWKRRVHNLREFYRPFVSKGSLVFDVGANVGEYTRCFVGLGAERVIAVEPSPQCVNKLRSICNARRVTVVPCAVGPEASFATLHLNVYEEMATVSEEWVRLTQASSRLQDMKWEGSIEVPVVTLNSLIEQYGKPDFIKIDVEGYESHVLDGLATAPPVLAFEFNPEWLNDTVACLQKPCFPPRAKCNYVIGEPHPEMALANWVPIDEMVSLVSTPDFCRLQTFGDIVVRTD
jgi:FkbM family methyltransferase